ncbi:hypothetical protein BFP70_06850 [Thioclava sp. SK-1]|nr:hypothetical protein BFP70_06850 [Thioclava sp. SK-1]
MKLCSILFVTGWGAALVFVWLARHASLDVNSDRLALNLLLAAIGGVVGMCSWLSLNYTLSRRGL